MDGQKQAFAFLIFFLLIILGMTKFSDAISNFFIKIFILIRNFKLYIKIKYTNSNTINREIDAKYSPAVLSYFYNFKLEPKKDILATILNLFNRKVISIEKTNSAYNFIPNNNIDPNILPEDERYIFNFLLANKENILQFSAEEWQKIVIKECERIGFNKKIEFSDTHKLTLFPIILNIIIILLFGDNILSLLFNNPTSGILFVDILLSILFAILNFLPLIVVEDKILYIKQLLNGLTKKGKNEIVKWIKFKNFIKNYTLIKDRKIEEIVIYEKYIPYAMALSINKEYNNENIKEFVEHYMKTVDKNVTNYFYTDFFN